ncbi:MAG: hypothetical protein P8R42_06610 [Candidatus Binatia bacterium]|nr:hypothetical protein [Candidatus Binatia bacterium]
MGSLLLAPAVLAGTASAAVQEPVELWRYGGCDASRSSCWYSPPAFKNGFVYGATWPLAAVWAADGTTLWETPSPLDGDFGMAGPLV